MKPTRADSIVQSLLGSPLTLRELAESPQYYPGGVVYQKDSKFARITPRNYGDYIFLGNYGSFVLAVHPQQTTGFVFSSADVANKPSLGMVPVMSVSLRDSGIRGYKQAHHLRIREGYAMQGAATAWYLAYVKHFGDIVSDFEHLEGGKSLWKSFVRTAEERGLKISLVDTVAGEWLPVGQRTPDETIWSLDTAKKQLVLVLEA